MPRNTRSPTAPRVKYEPALRLPPLPPEQYEALRDNIAVNGVLVPILVDEKPSESSTATTARPSPTELGYDCPEIVQAGLTDEEKRTLARALNLARRQLTRSRSGNWSPTSFGRRRSGRIAGSASSSASATPRWPACGAELEATGKVFQFDTTLGSDGKYRPKRLFQNPPELRRPHDFYPTPPHATQALVERERFTGLILEPACGDGAIVRVLRQARLRRGGHRHSRRQGLLRPNRNRVQHHHESPVPSYLDFIRHAKKIATRKIAMLLPVEFLHGGNPLRAFSGPALPPEVVYVFSSRLCFGSDTHATVGHAWYVWDRRHRAAPTLAWIP